MEVRVSNHDHDVTLNVSDTPCNSLDDLVTALLEILDGSHTQSVSWSLEPAYASWRFLRVEDALDLHVFPDDQATDAVVFHGERRSLIRSVFKGLCDLQDGSDWGSIDSSAHGWRWPFPRAGLAHLKAKLKTA